MVKKIKIGNSTITFEANAAVPRLYRMMLNRDVLEDVEVLYALDGRLSTEQMTVFENLAYIMAKQADKTIPDTVEDWLGTIDGVLSVYNIFPDILDLWNGNMATHSEAKKKVK